VNRRDVSDGRDEDLVQEPETLRAFRDTWELGIHSWLAYLRDRLLVVRDLLHESGSCFVQIGDQNLHLVRSVLDEIFGADNFVSVIPFRKKTMPLGTTLLEQMYDFVVWYAKSKPAVKYRQLFVRQKTEPNSDWSWFELEDGSRHKMTRQQVTGAVPLPERARIYRLKSLEPSGINQAGFFEYELDGRTHKPPRRGWSTDPSGMDALKGAHRLQPKGELLNYVLFLDDYPATALTSPWTDTVGPQDKRYVVQTSDAVVSRCVLMTTDPGDLALDPTCGSGTTAFVAEQWGRRWITCDTSRVSIALTKQRLMTTSYDYYELAHHEEGVKSGFSYKTIPHVTLSSITNSEPPKQETLYDQPKVDSAKVRVSGPFTVEAVPAPMVQPLDGAAEPPASDASVARSGETLRHTEWRAELLKTGVRGKSAQMITFSRVEPLAGTRWLHADAETIPNGAGADHVREVGPSRAGAQRVVVSFGPPHAPLEQRQVEMAWEEAQRLAPRPAIILFAAFQFDPEAAKDIDELTVEKTGMTFLKVQMNTDLLTDDLKKRRASNESFWLVGQPDVEVRTLKDGEHAGKLVVEVFGFDYFNTKTGEIESGDSRKIAMWMLDTDYDGRSLYPRQVFFPMAGETEGWARLARSLRAEIDPDLIESYRGTVSLPFARGDHRRIAVKIVDDRGIESLKIVEV